MSTELSGILAVWYREWKVYLREKSRIVASLVNPILWLVVFGGGVGSAVTMNGGNYQAFIYPGILAQAVLFSSIFFGVYIVWDRKIDFLKEVLVAPISRTGIFAGKVLGGATDAMVQSAVLLLLGIVLARIGILKGVHFSPMSLLLAAAVLLLTTISLVSTGLIIGSQMESPEGFQLISSFLLFPTFFLSGALFPLDHLPRWLRPLIDLDPLTYSVDALRQILLGQSHFGVAIDAAVMLGVAVVMMWIGTIAFERMRV